MPRHKKEKLETIDELIEEVQAAEKTVVEELNPQDVTPQPQLDVDKKRDVYYLVEKLTPFLPVTVGILSGGAIIAKYIYDHKSKPDVEDGNGTIKCAFPTVLLGFGS